MPGRGALARVLLLTLLAKNAWAKPDLVVLEVRHRPVEELVPIIQTLLEPGVALATSGNRLIARGEPTQLAAIATL